MQSKDVFSSTFAQEKVSFKTELKWEVLNISRSKTVHVLPRIKTVNVMKYIGLLLHFQAPGTGNLLSTEEDGGIPDPVAGNPFGERHNADSIMLSMTLMMLDAFCLQQMQASAVDQSTINIGNSL